MRPGFLFDEREAGSGVSLFDLDELHEGPLKLLQVKQV